MLVYVLYVTWMYIHDCSCTIMCVCVCVAGIEYIKVPIWLIHGVLDTVVPSSVSLQLLQKYTHTCTHACMHAYTHTCTHACMHAYTHMHTHTHTHTQHTHTHTHTHRLECPVEMRAVEDGDHRLSRPQDIHLLEQVHCIHVHVQCIILLYSTMSCAVMHMHVKYTSLYVYLCRHHVSHGIT